jgi:hypothetical protein
MKKDQTRRKDSRHERRKSRTGRPKRKDYSEDVNVWDNIQMGLKDTG